MKLTKRERTFIIVGFVAVAIIAYVFYFVMPQFSRQSALATQIMTATANLQTLKQKSAMMDNLKKQAETLQADINGQTQNIPHGSNDAIILLYLRQLADRTGVDISVSFAQDQTETDAFVQRLAAVEFKSSYAKASKFLEELGKEELSNKVMLVNAGYEPAQAGQGGDSTTVPTITMPTTDTVKTHIELTFQAFKLMDGETPSSPPVAANIKDRAVNLFPD